MRPVGVIALIIRADGVVAVLMALDGIYRVEIGIRRRVRAPGPGGAIAMSTKVGRLDARQVGLERDATIVSSLIILIGEYRARY